MAIMQLVQTEDGDFLELDAPEKLQSGRVTMMLPYGSLFFAAARDFEEEAPSANEASSCSGDNNPARTSQTGQHCDRRF